MANNKLSGKMVCSKSFSLLFLFLLIMTVPALAASNPISVSVENIKPSILAGQTAEYNAVIFNEYSEAVGVVLTVSGPKADSWVLPYDYSVEILPGAFTKIPLKIRPLDDAPSGNYAYSLLVQYRTGDAPWTNLEVAPTLVMNVVQPKSNFTDLAKIYVSVFDEKVAYVPGDTIQAQVQIYSLKQVFPELDATIQLLDSQERPVYSYTTPVTSQKEPIKPVSQNIPLGTQVLPGTYHVSATLSSDTGVIATARKTITISEVRKLDEKRIVSNGVFSRKISKYVENLGNVPAGGTLVETIYWYEKFLMTADPAPNLVPIEGGKLNLIWTFDSAKPGERTRTFSYSVSYLPAVLSVVLLLLLALLAWQRVKAISVSKEVIKQRIANNVLEATLSVHVTNKTETEMKDVVLTDYIPNLAKPVEFGTAKPTETRADKMETALIWKLGSLKGGEERVITYKIRTTVGVLGSIDLPSANASFKKADGKDGFVRSNTAECGRNV
ncbi:MAG: hypothetical protein V1820_00740 [archaeon]